MYILRNICSYIKKYLCSAHYLCFYRCSLLGSNIILGICWNQFSTLKFTFPSAVITAGNTSSLLSNLLYFPFLSSDISLLYSFFLMFQSLLYLSPVLISRFFLLPQYLVDWLICLSGWRNLTRLLFSMVFYEIFHLVLGRLNHILNTFF